MNVFLKKVLLISGLPVLMLLLFMGYVTHVSKSYEIGADIKNLYVGDSHIQFAIIDSLLLDSENVSKGAESYYYTYFKLKLLLEKQHREMISSLRLLVSALEKVGSNDANVIRAIQENSANVVEFIDKVSSQSPSQPNITVNQEQVATEVKNLTNQLIPFMEELQSLSIKFKESIDAIQNKKPVEWEFVIDRGFNNRIEKIIAKPK